MISQERFPPFSLFKLPVVLLAGAAFTLASADESPGWNTVTLHESFYAEAPDLAILMATEKEI